MTLTGAWRNPSAGMQHIVRQAANTLLALIQLRDWRNPGATQPKKNPKSSLVHLGGCKTGKVALAQP